MHFLIKKSTFLHFQKSKKNTQPRKKQKSRSDLNEAEEINAKEAQISNICSSEDDAVSQELNGELASALNSDGKPRANRGAATDPQSLYARVGSCHPVIIVVCKMFILKYCSLFTILSSCLQKRRERINERLKILQNLVPNGTKVCKSRK